VPVAAGTMVGVSSPGTAARSLPLILARELASNLATPMFLLDSEGTLVFFNDAAALLLGKTHAEVGEISSLEFGESLRVSTLDGEPLRRRDTPSGIAFFQHRPAHLRVLATTYDGVRRAYEATSYPLLGATGEMHGVVAVFWPDESTDGAA
jgi:PAS domain-containing protein